MHVHAGIQRRTHLHEETVDVTVTVVAYTYKDFYRKSEFHISLIYRHHVSKVVAGAHNNITCEGLRAIVG